MIIMFVILDIMFVSIYIMSVFLTICHRCTFHLFTQEWNSIPRSHLSKESKLILQKLKKWIDTWIFNLDRENHFLDSMQKFKSVLKSEECDEIRAPVSKIIESLEVCTAKWAKCYKKKTFDLGHTTTSPGEASNSSLKRFCKGNMSSQSLSVSARTQRDHSVHMAKKRNTLIAKELDRVSADTFMEDQNIFSQFAQTNVYDVLDRSEEYVPMRIGKNKFLVCHKNTFSVPLNMENNDKFQYPRYSNVHLIVLNEDKKSLECETCKIQIRIGHPCTHICCVTKCVNAEMINPRYLKVFNSIQLGTDKDFKEILEKLKIEYQKFGNSTNIMSIYSEVTESMKIEQYEEWSDIHKSMFALHNMHIQNECLIRGSEIPSKYRNTGNKTDKNDIELSEDNYIQEFPYNEEIGEEFEALYSSPVKKKGLEEFDTSIYQFLQYKNQELLNLVQGTPEAETMLRERMNEIVSDLRKMQLKNGKTNFSQESTIVSSNMKQSTTPKNHNRTKRKHEMFSQPSSWKKRPQKKNARTKRASK